MSMQDFGVFVTTLLEKKGKSFSWLSAQSNKEELMGKIYQLFQNQKKGKTYEVHKKAL